MTVTLTQAAPADAPLLQNLIQLYTHDFSEFWAGTTRGDLAPDGRFQPYPLDAYWTTPAWSALLVWSGGVLAGFALVNDQAHSGLPTGANVAEFFILRKHRGQGVGRLAALAVFALRPGSWELAIARKNVAAGAFWRRTVQAAPPASNLQELDLDDAGWNGPILRFDYRGAVEVEPNL
jgi:predicted acetyltransferase